ncbi:MAG: lysophospholipid acyltransferase family protein [Myxococcales bacterium]|nr:lysophospholipid acyltransferase family protein [Myxococcales bacterium]
MLAWLVGALGPSGRRALAFLVGTLAYLLGLRRRVALDNLRHAFPELAQAARRRVARGAYVNMALAALEALAAPSLSDAEVERAVVVENWAPIEEAIRAGKGLLVASAHFGSWELFAEVMARRGVRLNAVVRPLRGALNARIVESRRRAGLGLILQRGALSGIIAAVRRGEVVAQLVDQALPSRRAVFVPFFGRLASTTPALSVAAMRTGAPVFVVMAAREGNRLRMFAEGPIPLPSSGDRRRDIEEHVAALTAIIERYIRRYPDQWLWLHRRWKVQPPAAKSGSESLDSGALAG